MFCRQNWSREPLVKYLFIPVPSNSDTVGELTKLKELCLLNNPLADNRLKKMAAQKTTKSVLEYIRQNGDKGGEEDGAKVKEIT